MRKSKLLQDWLECLNYLQKKIPYKNFIIYIAAIKFKKENKNVILLTPNKYIKNIIEFYYYGIIKDFLEKKNKDIKIIIKEDNDNKN